MAVGKRSVHVGRWGRRLVCFPLLVVLCMTFGACGKSHDASVQVSAPGHKVRSGSLTQVFPILATHPEGLPEALRKAMRHPRGGERWTAAQVVRIADGQYWLVEGAHKLCILRALEGGVSEVCSPDRFALIHGISLVTITPHSSSKARRWSRLIAGLAPIAVGEAKIRTGGSIIRVPVRRGQFVFRDSVNQPPALITFQWTP